MFAIQPKEVCSKATAQIAADLKRFLKTGALISSLALPTIALTEQAALAGKHNFEVYNDSSEDIVGIYVTDSQTASWGKNLLGKMSVIPSGSSMQIAFGDPSEAVCLYDILTVFESGEMVEEYGVDVCYYDYYALLNE